MWKSMEVGLIEGEGRRGEENKDQLDWRLSASGVGARKGIEGGNCHFVATDYQRPRQQGEEHEDK